MARPTKQGLEYFALDVKMDDETELIEAEHGHKGFVVLIKMFQKIYSSGYYIKWDEKQQLLFSKKISVDRNEVTMIVNDCLKWDVFNGDLFKKHGILTSRRIQDQYSRSVYKRVGIIMHKEYLLIDVSDNNNIEVTRVSDNRNSNVSYVSDSKSTQSKREESKGDKTREDPHLQIENLRQRYSLDQLKIIDNYLEMIRHTRISGKMSKSVILGMYEYWDKHPDICVEYGLKTHTDNVAYHSRKENYTFGIIKNTTADEAQKKLKATKTSSESNHKKDPYKSNSLDAHDDIEAMGGY